MPDGINAGQAYLDIVANLAPLQRELESKSAAALKPLDDKATALGDKISSRFKGLGDDLQKVGLAGVAVGGVLTASAEHLAEAHANLAVALHNNNHEFSDFAKPIADATSHMASLGHTSADVQGALAKMVNATHDPAFAIANLGVVADLAATKHIGLADAAAIVDKVYGGAAKPLKEFGLTAVDTGNKAADGAANVAKLAAAVSGQAEAQANTPLGFVRELKARVENAVASLGERFGPVILGVGTALSTIGTIIESDAVPKLANLAKSGLQAAGGLAGISEGAGGVAAGLGVVAGAAVVAGGAFLLYSQTVATNKREHAELVQSLTAGTSSLAERHAVLTKGVADTAAQIEKLRGAQSDQNGQTVATLKAVGDASEKHRAYSEALKQTSEAMRHNAELAAPLAASITGVTVPTSQLSTELQGLADHLGVDLAKASGDVLAKLNAQIVGMHDASAATGELRTATETLDSTWSTAIEKSGAFAAGISALQDRMTASLTGAIDFEDGIARLGAAVEKNGSSLDIHTQKGRDNERQLIALTQAAEKDATAIYTQTGSLDAASSTYAKHISDLEATARQLGFNDQQINTLLNSLGVYAARDWAAKVTLDGADTALAALVKLNDFKLDAKSLDVYLQNHPGASGADALTDTSGFFGDIPGKAAGGSVLAGHDYWVGERGPEIVRFPTDGWVFSHGTEPYAFDVARSADHGGVTFAEGAIVIYNPTPEPAATSITREMRRAVYLAGL